MSKLNEFTAKFTDAFKIEKPSDKDFKIWNESFKDSLDDNKKVLRIVMRASHSALINRNNRFYIPSRMRDNVDTFINGNKPAKVLLNHDSDQPPVGIIREARYIDDIPEDLKDNPEVATLLDSKASVVAQLEAMKTLMKDGITSRKGWQGLGYVELVADIMDEKTIEMILDGRYDAVSTSFNSPGNAYCFICYKNWATSDKFPACEHVPGKTYEDDNEDKWKAMLIPTLHMNEEVSFVLKDADPLTSVSISDSVKGISHTEINDDSWRDNLETFDSKYEFKDKFEEDNQMAKKNKTVQMSDEAKAVLEIIKEQNPDMEEAKLNEFADQIAKMKIDGKYPNQDNAEIDNKTAVQYAFDSLTIEGEINADEVYAEIEKEIPEEMKDKKLSTEARKKLSDSTFCGPNRSFPVNDCAHYTAAKRLIGRYKGPGDKAKILACINRKGKALGCDAPQKDETVETSEVKFEMPSCECVAAASDAEALALYNKAEAECISRHLKVDRPCAKCADAENETKKAQDALKELEAKIKDSENIINVLREELRFQAVDYASQVDALVAVQEQLKEAKADKLAIVGTLSGQYENLDSAKEAIVKDNVDSLEQSIMDNFDLEAAYTKLNDGMDHKPKAGEPLEDPTQANVEVPFSDKNLNDTGKAALETFKDMLNNDKIEKAKDYFVRMQRYNLFPDSYKLEELMAAYKKESAEE